MDNVKKILKDDLNNNIYPFWNNLIDKEYGGFYGATDINHEIIKEAPKGIVYISRLLYSFSSLYTRYKDLKYLRLADISYKFMIEKLHDKEYGGFYWSTNYDGTLCNDHKHLYGNSFALYGLAAYYIATQNEESLIYSKQVLDIIANSLVDFPNNYSEENSKDFKPLPNQIMMGFDMVPEITTNTLLHLAESLSLYYYGAKDELAKELTIKLLDIIFDKGYDSNKKNLYQFLNYKLENQIEVYSYGHNLEVAWLFMDIMKFCEYENQEYINKCMEMLKENFELSYNGNYIINETVNNVTDKSAIWWVQAEALIALNTAYKITKQNKYLEAVRNITEFILKHFINEGKEWYWGINEDLTIQKSHSICEMWKANYHIVRSMLKILEESDGK